MVHRHLAASLGLALVLGGCAAVRDDMVRAEASFEQARYEDTLVWLADLEDDAPSMDPDYRARYYYLRGMTEYRLGHRSPALHYLALAREVSGEQGTGLRPEWRSMMERTLGELTPRGMTHLPPAATDEAAATESAGGSSDVTAGGT